MLNLVSKIIITQQPNITYPLRNKVYVLDFVNEVTIESTWKNLTTTAKLIIPKKVFIKEGEELINWDGEDFYANSPTAVQTPPIVLRGDKIKMELGYYYNTGTQEQPDYQTNTNVEFDGYITKINPKMPMEIECEDNMWLLKQAQCPNMVFPANTSSAIYTNGQGKSIKVSSYDGKSWDVQSIITALLQNAYIQNYGTDGQPSNPFIKDTLLPELSNINVINGEGLSENVSTNVGSFRTLNETIAGVLMRLRKDYKLECFFRKNTTTQKWNDLYVSGIVYYSKDYISQGKILSTNYDFQQNIIDGNNLIYLRKDDVRLGIKAYSVGKYELTTTNSSGANKTKSVRLEANVGDQDGDIRTMYFWPKTDTSKDLDLENLKTLANQALVKLKYEGWRGTFLSFGLPYVQHGQAVTLTDNIIPERTGTYLVKGTKVMFGQRGFRRQLELHIRIDSTTGLKVNDFLNGL